MSQHTWWIKANCTKGAGKCSNKDSGIIQEEEKCYKNLVGRHVDERNPQLESMEVSGLMDECADGKQTAARGFGLMHDHTANFCHSRPTTGDSSCSDFV